MVLERVNSTSMGRKAAGTHSEASLVVVWVGSVEVDPASESVVLVVCAGSVVVAVVAVSVAVFDFAACPAFAPPPDPALAAAAACIARGQKSVACRTEKWEGKNI